MNLSTPFASHRTPTGGRRIHFLATLLFALPCLLAAIAPTVTIDSGTTVSFDEDTNPNFDIEFTIDDPDTIIANLIVTVASSDDTVIPDANLTLNPAGLSSDPTRIVEVEVPDDAFGTTLITVTVSDGTDSNSADVTVNIAPVNDAPSYDQAGPNNLNSDLGDIDEDTGPYTVSDWAENIDKGAANEFAQTLTFVLTPDDPGLFSSLSIDPTSGDLSFTLAAHQNGTANVSVRLEDNGGGDYLYNNGDSFSVTVDPVPDDPDLVGDFSVGSTSGTAINDDSAAVSIFSAMTIDDPDDDEPDPEFITATVELLDDGELFGEFIGQTNPFTISGSPASVSTALQAVQFVPFPNVSLTDAVYNLTIRVTMQSEQPNSPVSEDRDLYLFPVNDPPTLDVEISPTGVLDSSGEFNPFRLIFIDDPDPFDLALTLTVDLVNASDAAFGTLSSSPASFTGTPGELADGLGSVGFNPIDDSVADMEIVEFEISANDGTNTVSEILQLQIFGDNSLPDILPSSSIEIAIDDDETVQPFNQSGNPVRVEDSDLGGNQPVTIELSLDNTLKGTFGLSDPIDPTTPLGATTATLVFAGGPVTSYADAGGTDTTVTATGHGLSDGDTIVIQGSPDYSGVHTIDVTGTNTFTIGVPYAGGSTPDLGTWGLTPATATRLLQTVLFIPENGRVPDLASESVFITLIVTDSSDGIRKKTIKLVVTGRNGQPIILGLPDVEPLQVPPATAKPFADLEIIDDDVIPEVTVRVALDVSEKGVLVGAFTEVVADSGVYEFVGTPAGATSALQDLTFEVNEDYVFPAGAPGATTFSLEVEDTIGNLATASFSIVLEDASRNFLVTRIDDDEDEGSLRFAVANSSDGDFITFALIGEEAYPEIIRLDSALGPIVLDNNVTIKGPGADMLVISGDMEGDLVPDTQIFQISAAVTIEALGLADGIADGEGANTSTGGAIYIDENGRLILRYVEIANSVANQWGGAIDVDGGSLVAENCLFRGNVTDPSLGLGGGAVSLYTDLTCSFVNTTFSGNMQLSTSGLGGGAIYAENRTPEDLFTVDVIHCTFARNDDVTDQGTSIHANVFGTRIQPLNSIFADGLFRNLEVRGAADFVSQGGNLSDDNTRTIILRSGVPKLTTLLDGTDDQVGKDDLNILPLAQTVGPMKSHPLASASSAIGNAIAPAAGIDQRGVVRADGDADSGAFEYGSDTRILINEIRHEPDPGFVELYVTRDSMTTLALDDYELWVDGSLRHVFAASTNVLPGKGILVADASFSAGTGAVVVVASETPALGETPLNLEERGLVELKDAVGRVVARASYTLITTDFSIPPSDLNFADNSVTLVPQFRGAAFVPHSLVYPPTVGGIYDPAGILPTDNKSSPGADTGDTDFGAPNAKPLAITDNVVVSEDEWIDIAVLANDLDADGAKDLLAITDLSAVSNDGTIDASITTGQDASATVDPFNVTPMGNSVVYDPRISDGLQSLPAGVEAVDTFYYIVKDFDPDTNLERAADSFREGTINVTILGINDPPTPNQGGADAVATFEDEVLRIMGDSDLAGSATVFDTDDEYDPVPDISAVSLLSNDNDPDSDEFNPLTDTSGPDDDGFTLKIVGVVGAVKSINGYTGTVGESPVTVTSPAHGLVDAEVILISGYEGHSSYNDFHEVTVIDEDTFSIPVVYVDTHTSGEWAILNDANRLEAISPLEAEVKLEIRSDRNETNVVYNPQNSATLNALGIKSDGTPQTAEDSFYYAVEDSHGAVSLAMVSVTVSGVNDAPVSVNNPNDLLGLDEFVNGMTLAEIIGSLEVNYALPLADAMDLADARVVFPDGDSEVVLSLQAIWIINEDTVLTIDTDDLLANDSDVDSPDNLSVVEFTGTTEEGALVTVSGGILTYDPTYNPAAPDPSRLDTLSREELLVDSFEITISDNSGGPSGTPALVTQRVAVIVVGTNLTPVAIDDNDTNLENGSTLEDVLLEIPAAEVLANDTDADMDEHEPDDILALFPADEFLTTSGQAAVVITADGITYDPAGSAILDALPEGGFLDDTFTYTVMDGSFIFAVDDFFQVEADNTDLVLEVMANDRNLTGNGSQISIIEVGVPSDGGSVSIDDNGTTITYTPQVNFVGDEVFAYTLSDEDGNTDTAIVKVGVIVNQLNGNLQANDDAFTVAKGESPTLNVLANDNIIPASGGNLTITNVSAVSAVIAGDSVEIVDNQIVFQQGAANSSYTATFTYDVSGGGIAQATATVSVYVDDLSGDLPLRSDSFAVLAGSVGNELDVLANDNILPGEVALLVISGLGTPSHGTVEISEGGTNLLYTPAAGFVGEDSFTYEALDGFGSTGSATVDIVVGSLTTNNDFFSVAYDSSGSIEDDGQTALDVLANDRVLGDGTGSLRIISVTPENPVLGEMSLNGPSNTLLLFDPAVDEEGEQTFIYTIEDVTTGRTAEGQVTVIVLQSAISANPDYFSVQTDSEENELLVIGNDTAIPPLPASRSLSILSLGTGADAPNRGGFVEINEDGTGLIYTPAAGFAGEETFTYTLTDSRRTDIAKVVVKVSSGELSANEDAFTVYYETFGDPIETQTFSLPVLANDRVLPDFGQALTITGVGIDDGEVDNAPDKMGIVEISEDGTSLIYTPPYNGGLFDYFERFTYVVSDGTARRAEGVVTVEVRERSSAREMETNDDSFTVQGASSGNLLDVLANDAVKPASTAGWMIASVSPPNHGGVVSNSGIALVYTPQPNFVGIETFTYEITDGLGGTGVAVVNVRVGDLPVASDQFVAVSDGSESLFAVLVNDAIRPATPLDNADPLNDFVLLDARDSDMGGSLSLVGNLVAYTPNPPALTPFPYTESFVYDLIDDAGGIVSGTAAVTVHEAGSDRSTAVVTIRVDGVNDAPVIDTSGAVTETITDKETALPFAAVTFVDVDTPIITVTVALDDPESGTLISASGFTETAPLSRVYTFTGSPAAATTAIQLLLFDPRENYLSVPELANFGFTITADDLIVPTPVVDTSISVNVQAENDAPVIQGTISDQTVYHLSTIYPFAAVSVTDVDDQAMQPLVVTVSMDEPSHGTLSSNLGFMDLGGGLYTIGGTPAEVTAALRDLLFVPDSGGRLTADLTAPPESERTVFTIMVDDGFAPAVVDSDTSVITLLGLITKQLAADGSSSDSLGFSSAASRNIIVAGAPDDDDKGNGSGSAYVYARDQGGPGQWGQLAKLLATDAGNTAGDQFGYAVAIGFDTTIVVGAPTAPAGGAVYIFEPDGSGTGWLPGVKLTGPGASTGDEFGAAIAIYGDRLVVGARFDGDSGNDSGAVYEFERTAPGTWIQVGAKLHSADIAAGDEFGSSLSLDASSLLVGSPMDDDNGSASGSAYLFDRDVADNWIQTKKILPVTGAGTNDGMAADQFGYSVTLSGDTAIVGSPFEDDNGNDAGAAFVFQRDLDGANNWGFVAKLLAEAIYNNDRFGFSVSIDREIAIVAAPLAGETNQSKFGSVAAFGRNEGGTNTWGQLEVIDPPDPYNNDEFGYSVSIAGGIVVVGSHLDDALGNDSGSVYIYELRPNNAPEVGMGIPDQWAADGLDFEFTIPFDAFGDPDVDEELSIEATLVGGASLPAWLSFDPLTATFSGQPAFGDVGPALMIEVTVADYEGETASTVFEIEVLAEPPSLFAPYTSDLPITWLGTLSSSSSSPAFDPEAVSLSLHRSSSSGSALLRYAYAGSISDSGLILQTSLDLQNWSPAGEWISGIGIERSQGAEGTSAVLFELKKIAIETEGEIRFYRVISASVR